MKNYLPLFLRHQDAITIKTEDGLEISIDDGLKLIRLNGTAKTVWELTAAPISLDDIVNNIANIYGRAHTLIRDEVLQFLDNATQHGLILQFISQAETSHL